MGAISLEFGQLHRLSAGLADTAGGVALFAGDIDGEHLDIRTDPLDHRRPDENTGKRLLGEAPDGQRGFYTSWIQTTATVGLFLSLLVIGANNAPPSRF